MIWQKEKGTENSKNLDYMIIATVFFFLIGVVFNQVLLFAVIGIMLGYLLFTKVYDYQVGQKLSILNNETSIRLFPGDEAELKFELDNRSFIPYVNGQFSFQAQTNINVVHDAIRTYKREQFVQVPLSVFGKQKSTITLSIIATGRGTTKIKNINYQFPNLPSFATMTLRYVPYYDTEYVIFPEPIRVEGLKHYFQQTTGEQRRLFSPYEDVLRSYGTRAYNYSDPFHKINWKASAKSQTLQTNVYDQVLNQSLLIIVNLGIQRGTNMTQINPNMEKLLSYATYICQYATEEHMPYKIMINVRKPGRTPYIQMAEGTGKAHYVRALEMFARIPHQPLIVPINQIVHQTMQQIHESQTIIMIGDLPPPIHGMMNRWQSVQSNILYVDNIKEGATIQQWKKAVTTHAT